jgi:hypothetical protein
VQAWALLRWVPVQVQAPVRVRVPESEPGRLREAQQRERAPVQVQV